MIFRRKTAWESWGLLICAAAVTVAAEPLRIACIGDSITFGSGITAESERYPAVLQELLGPDYAVRNFGDPGRGILQASRRGTEPRAYSRQPVHQEALAFLPDVVICNLGINDVDDCRAGGWASLTPDYVELIRTYQALPTHPKVFIWTRLAPLAASHRCVTWEEPFVMRRYLAEAARVTAATEIDMFAPLFGRPALLQADGIHPNAAGARIIAAATRDRILPMLTGKFGGLRLPYVFADHMVLQHGMPIPVWGRADRGQTVRVTLAGESASTAADAAGNWQVNLSARAPGGPFELQIEAEKTVVLRDVLLGDVWLSAGQSNMYLPLRQCDTAREDLTAADRPRLRLLNRQSGAYPNPGAWDAAALARCTADLLYQGEWTPTNAASAADFSAVAYHFACRLQHDLGIPIGIINIPIGGATVEAFISEESLLENPALRPMLARNDGWLNSPLAPPWPRKRARENLAGWLRAPTATVPHHPFEPGFLFEAAVRPISAIGLRGVIWYQGESNATASLETPDTALDPTLMQEGFHTVIADWRRQFGRPELPFLYVQLPNLNRPWMAFRQMQLNTLAQIPGTGMAVTIDVGNPTDVHPRTKKPVGERLALWALSRVYDRDLVCSGPLFKSMSIAGREVLVQFDFGDGLHASDNAVITGFELAAADGRFYPATATVSEGGLRVGSEQVSVPAAVRYAWAPNPACNLVNAANLPASPFQAGANMLISPAAGLVPPPD